MRPDMLINQVPLNQVKSTALAHRTRVRHKVVGLVIVMGMLTYLDRVAISKLAPNIMGDLSLSKVQMGYVFSAFALAYAIFEMPSAWWADRTGTRSMLTRALWSGGPPSRSPPPGFSVTVHCWRFGFYLGRVRLARGRAWRARFPAGFPAGSGEPSREYFSRAPI